MAKTFKNLPPPGQAATPKPISERDFFDLSDEPPTAERASESLEKEQAISNPSTISNTSNTEKIDNISNIGNTGKLNNTGHTSNTGNSKHIGNPDNTSDVVLPADLASRQQAVVTAPTSTQEAVRQTFVLSRGHLEQLRDYVHARRAQGDYTYSQKQALQQALELLFALDSPAPPRPAHTREQEQQHRQRIRQGRRSRSSE